MKQIIYTFLLLTAIVLVSCKKNQYQPDIKQYDDDQIQAYIKNNGITGMIKDTSGMYYKIIYPGSGPALQYTDSIGMVYTVKDVSGKYAVSDTILNHFEGFLGEMQTYGYPIGGQSGLQEAVHNLLKHKGGIMRVIVPSHLAYGVSGAGSGSSAVTNNRIPGNQSLDYYVHVMDNQDAYDQTVIKNYITANGLTDSMKYDPSGIWYEIRTPGTGTIPITENSTITATYTLKILNNIPISDFNRAGGTSIDVPDLIPGMQIGLKKYATAGSLITFLIPSSLGTGKHSDGSAPPNSCLRYEIQVIDVGP